MKIKIIISTFLLTMFLNAQVHDIEIDLSTRYHEIDNFSASDCWSFQKIGEWPTIQKNKVADLLFSVDNGIGLSAWRFNIGGGINHNRIGHSWRTVETFETGQDEYDWTRQEEERWFLQAAKERGVDQFIAFVNSPPARMTRNGFTNCTDGLGSTNLKEGYEDQFAEYLADILEHFRDEWQIEFDYISPVNEPQWEWNASNQEGNRASNADIINIAEALYEKLQEKELNTEISLLESGNLESWHKEIDYLQTKYGEAYGNYLDNVIKNSRLTDKISHHLDGHSYWSDLLDSELIEHRQTLLLKILPKLVQDWKYWMTEYCVMEGPFGNGGHGRDLSINTALNVARVIHHDLTILRASAWQWWTAVSPEDYKDGLIYTDYMDNPNSMNIIESKTLWALGNFSKFIRPGYFRVDYSGENNKEGLMGSAYVSPDNNKIVIVFVNTDYSGQTVKMNFSGLADKEIKTLTPYVTTNADEDDLKEYSQIGTDDEYDIPARSVVTLVGNISDSNAINETGNNADTYQLFQNYPNPFNSGTKISYLLKKPADVKITVYSITGEKVLTLFNNHQTAGQHNLTWNGTDSSNRSVGSGIYLYSLQTNTKKIFKKMVFIQ